MNQKHKLRLTLALTVILLFAIPLTTVWADCPGPRIYVGGTGDGSGVRGSMTNPVSDMNEAFDICQECSNGAYVYRYSAGQQKYVYAGRCTPEEAEPTGDPLAQPILTALMGLLAVGLLAWGIYLRLQLKRLQTGG